MDNPFSYSFFQVAFEFVGRAVMLVRPFLSVVIGGAVVGVLLARLVALVMRRQGV